MRNLKQKESMVGVVALTCGFVDTSLLVYGFVWTYSVSLSCLQESTAYGLCRYWYLKIWRSNEEESVAEGF
jgi:hypothetical protein